MFLAAHLSDKCVRIMRVTFFHGFGLERFHSCSRIHHYFQKEEGSGKITKSVGTDSDSPWSQVCQHTKYGLLLNKKILLQVGQLSSLSFISRVISNCELFSLNAKSERTSNYILQTLINITTGVCD